MSIVPPNRRVINQGMNWITPHKRLAIYARDEFTCCYCKATLADGIHLTLDHLKPYVRGGTNHETNLVTCCRYCNTARGMRPWWMFARLVADRIGVSSQEIIARIRRNRYRAIRPAQAKAYIERCGSFTAALQTR